MRLRLRSLFALTAILLVLPAAGSLANPLPDAALFTHVQPWVQGEPPAVSNCFEIIQHTTATGSLEFDLYLRPFFAEAPYGARSLQASLQWDEDWSWIGYEIPYTGTGSVIVSGNQATVDIDWPGILQGEDEVLLLLRCFVQVTGYGQLDCVGGSAMVTADCFGEYPMEVWSVPGTAGVVCDWCYADCGLQSVCKPVAQTPVANLQVVEGGTVDTVVDFHVNMQGTWPCPVNYFSSEDWLSFVLDVENETTHHLALTLDSEGLAPGNYSAWLRGEADCVGCMRVNFEVLTTTGLEESSISSVKSRY